MRRFLPFGFVLIVLAACSQQPQTDVSLVPESFSSSQPDIAYDVAANGAGVYVTGSTRGSLETPNPATNWNAFIRKYTGNTVNWGRQFAFSNVDYGYDIAADSQGNSYVVGETLGPDTSTPGGRDIYLRSYDASGTVRWTRQFGSNYLDSLGDVATDAQGNVYTVSNELNVNFVIRKWSSSGTLLKTIRSGNVVGYYPRALAVDSQGFIYLLASAPAEGELNAFLLRYSATGSLTRTRKIIIPGSQRYKDPEALAIDSADNVVVAVNSGFTSPTFAHFVKYQGSDGSRLWYKTLKARPVNFNDAVEINGIAVDGDNIYITGSTSGTFIGNTNPGINVAFVMRYTPLGQRLWVQQVGSSGVDIARSVAVSDSVYVVGSTTGNLLAQPKTGSDEDAFIARFDKTTGATLGIDQ